MRRLGDRHAEWRGRSEEHTSELQSLAYLVCRLLLEKKKSVRAVPDCPRPTGPRRPPPWVRTAIELSGSTRAAWSRRGPILPPDRAIHRSHQHALGFQRQT